MSLSGCGGYEGDMPAPDLTFSLPWHNGAQPWSPHVEEGRAPGRKGWTSKTTGVNCLTMRNTLLNVT